MFGSRCVVLAGSLCAIVVCTSIAQAAGGGGINGGTITFVGAIVAPTCSIATESNSLTAAFGEAVGNRSQRQTCSGPGGEAVNASRVYSVSVERLSNSEPDQVLAYFDHYVKAGQPGAEDPVLVTQTYE
jgi:hypothetical protein